VIHWFPLAKVRGNPVLPGLYPFRLDAGLIDTVPFSFIETLFSSKDAEAAGYTRKKTSDEEGEF